MSRITPKPIIARVAETWRVPPGMTFAVVEDMEQTVWVVQSCPAGTQFWTVEQFANLPQGRATRKAMKAALELSRKVEASLTERKAAQAAKTAPVRNVLPPRREPLPTTRNRRASKPMLANTGKTLITV
jgi:hypothetical protein